MLVQVITTCDYQGGSLQHAVTLAQALASLQVHVRMVNVRAPTPSYLRVVLEASNVEVMDTTSDDIPQADVDLIVDLLPESCREAAMGLVCRKSRLILVPTGYLSEDPLPSFPGNADALWFVSWDQAADSRRYWHWARRIEVVRCSVDVNCFRPAKLKSGGPPWLLCRHSRDRPEKFSPDVAFVAYRLAEEYEVTFKMLGAIETLGQSPDDRIATYAQGSLDPAVFLQDAHIWLYNHASYWRETACIAMLEAMACGLPVVVRNAGGMREYMAHGQTGFLCNNTEEFLTFTRLLFDHQSLYSSMVQKARQFVVQHYSVDNLAHRLQDLLQVSARCPVERRQQARCSDIADKDDVAYPRPCTS